MSGSLPRIWLYARSLACARTDGAAFLQGVATIFLLAAPWLAHLGGSPPMSAGALPPEFIHGSRRTFSFYGCFSALCLHVSHLWVRFPVFLFTVSPFTCV